MKDHLGSLDRDQHDDFEEVPGAVGTDDEPSVRLLADIFDRQSVLDGVEHVIAVHVVSAGRGVDLDTRLLYYRNGAGQPTVPEPPTDTATSHFTDPIDPLRLPPITRFGSMPSCRARSTLS